MNPEFFFRKKYETELGTDPRESINIVKQTRNYHIYILKWILYVFRYPDFGFWSVQLCPLNPTYESYLWRYNRVDFQEEDDRSHVFSWYILV